MLTHRATEQKEFNDDLKQWITQLKEQHLSKVTSPFDQSTEEMDNFFDRLEKQIVEITEMGEKQNLQLDHYGYAYSPLLVSGISNLLCRRGKWFCNR